MNKRQAKKEASTLLRDNEHIRELLKILRDNEMSDKAKNLTELTGYVDTLENQFSQLMEEIQNVREKLEVLENKKSPLREKLDMLLDRLEEKERTAMEQIQHLKSQIVQGAKQAVTAFQDRGVVALNDLAGFFHIKEAFTKLHSAVQAVQKQADQSIEKIQNFGRELGQAKAHMKAAGYALAGKEIKVEDSKESRLLQAAMIPFGFTSGAAIILGDQLGKVTERVRQIEERAASVGKNKTEKKPSIMKKLQDCQEKAENGKAVKAAEQKHQKKKEAEL